ncbi:MAG: 2Fe-2S iron-sulfur cluster binding domain-containing protein [Rubrivivax sp.]|nr:MAG: 2Fe-2S iron-sulfur cluster binding domain-containing protein [Rubrivivax sp.]
MPTDPTSRLLPPLSRRDFLQSATVVAGALAGESMPAGPAQAAPPIAAQPISLPAHRAALRPVVLMINGRQHQLSLEPRVTLLDALREDAGLMGTKKGCDRGQCGACTVLVDGRRINACMTLAVMQEGKQITTIEGLGQPDSLHPMQAAFLDHDAFQCGYCTPGQICSAVALLQEAKAGAASAVTEDLGRTPIALSDVEIRERMSGNLCRCGAYPNIVKAVHFVANAPATKA